METQTETFKRRAMKGQIRISVEPEEFISFLESNINELSFQQKKYMLKMIATSMSNKSEEEINIDIEDLIGNFRIK